MVHWYLWGVKKPDGTLMPGTVNDNIDKTKDLAVCEANVPDDEDATWMEWGGLTSIGYKLMRLNVIEVDELTK